MYKNIDTKVFIQTNNLKIKIKVMPKDGIEPGYKINL